MPTFARDAQIDARLGIIIAIAENIYYTLCVCACLRGARGLSAQHLSKAKLVGNRMQAKGGTRSELAHQAITQTKAMLCKCGLRGYRQHSVVRSESNLNIYGGVWNYRFDNTILLR